MAASRFRSSKYRTDQRINIISWTIVLVLAAFLTALHSWSTDRSTSPDDASPPVEPTMTMHAWLDQSQPSINGVVRARNNVAAAASRLDIPGTGRACQTATDAVTDLRNHMPSPDAAVNQTLQQAISSYTLGLPDCVSAARTVDGEGMQRAADYISYGDTAMQSALDILGDEAAPAPSGLGVLIV